MPSTGVLPSGPGAYQRQIVFVLVLQRTKGHQGWRGEEWVHSGTASHRHPVEAPATRHRQPPLAAATAADDRRACCRPASSIHLTVPDFIRSPLFALPPAAARLAVAHIAVASNAECRCEIVDWEKGLDE